MHFTDDIRNHALCDQPNEACGLIFQETGVFKARPCLNVWEANDQSPENDKTRFFRIDTKVMLDAWKTKALVGVYHSHTNADEMPTEFDRHAADAVGLPYFIYSTFSDRFSVYQPSNKPTALIGRPYVPQVYSCVSLVSDYLEQNLEVTIPPFEYTEEESFHGKKTGGAEYMLENGWRPVSVVRPFDVVVMTVKVHNFPNHIGVIMENGTHMLHHLYNQVSRVDPYGGYWKKATMLTLRHPKFFKKL